MAYPNPIKASGALSMVNDVFEYFKSATDAFLHAEEQNEYVSYEWEDLANDFLQRSYPITRNTFRDIVIDYMYDPEDLLDEPEPVSGWPITKVNDWAKVHCFELAMFGSVGGSGSDSTLPYLTGGLYEAAQWREHSMVYLRFALVYFDDYGVCYPEETYMPAPTSPVVNTSLRTFNWTNATGYNNLSDYEYSINGSDMQPVSSKPITIPGNITVPVDGIEVRTRGIGYTSPSLGIYNDIQIPSLQVEVQLNLIVYLSSPDYIYYISAFSNQQLDVNLTISGFASYKPVGGIAQQFPYSVQILSGDSDGYTTASAGAGSASVESFNILTANASPSTIGGQSVIVNY